MIDLFGRSGFSILKLLMTSPICIPDFFARPFQFNLSTVTWPFSSIRFMPNSSKSYSFLKLPLSITNNLYLSPYSVNLVTLI